MLHQLPAELSVYIIQTAAFQYRFSDRQSVVNIAMCNHTVYDIVAPILYHTLVVSHNNVKQLSSLASSRETRALAQRMLSHVRFFLNRSPKQHPLETHLLANVEHIATSSSTSLRYWAAPTLRSVHLLNLSFVPELLRITPSALRTITHVCGHLPMFESSDEWKTFFRDAAGWTRSLLERLPAVTHLGLTRDLPRAFDFHFKDSISRFDCTAIETVVRTALQTHPRLKCIAIRISGAFLETRRMDLEMALRNVYDPRLRVWFDNRPVEDWDAHRAQSFLDIEEGRNIWTEARLL